MRNVRPALLVVVLVAASACSRGPARAPRPPRDARSAALALFDLARSRAPSAEVRHSILDPELADRDGAALETALLPLREATEPRVVREEPIAALGLTAVEFSAAVRGGGEIRGSAHARLVGDGTWRIVWIATPGGSWPSRKPGPGEGSTSGGGG
jgi:hypothetical protein